MTLFKRGNSRTTTEGAQPISVTASSGSLRRSPEATPPHAGARWLFTFARPSGKIFQSVFNFLSMTGSRRRTENKNLKASQGGNLVLRSGYQV
jgi:hypothetical protein